MNTDSLQSTGGRRKIKFLFIILNTEFEFKPSDQDQTALLPVTADRRELRSEEHNKSKWKKVAEC